jgi:hypothetical protein
MIENESMSECEYGTPMSDEEREWERDRRRDERAQDMKAEQLHLRAFGLPADQHDYAGGDRDRHVWRVNLRRPETLALVEAAGFAVFHEDVHQRVGYIQRKPGPLVPRPVTPTKAYGELSSLEQRLNLATFTIGGSRVWDGGRLALPTSDVDIFVSMTRADLDVFTTTPCEAREWWFGARNVLPFPNCTVNLVVAASGHWALTGREEQQQRVLRGAPLHFKPAPGNADSSMIRRAALTLMGVELCEAGADVAAHHTLRSPASIENAVRWVEARAQVWSDGRLAALAKRVREAMAHGEDVREVL